MLQRRARSCQLHPGRAAIKGGTNPGWSWNTVERNRLLLAGSQICPICDQEFKCQRRHPRFKEHLQKTISRSHKIRTGALCRFVLQAIEGTDSGICKYNFDTYSWGSRSFFHKLHVHRESTNHALRMGLNQTEMGIHTYMHIYI